MNDKHRKILVTSALFYANGSIHLGHIVEVVQTDIWVRFQRMRGHTCLYVSGEDAHGTPIMLRAEKDGISPESLISKIGIEHRQDFQDFLISLDNYYTTHSPENKTLSEYVYQQLVAKEDIEVRTIKQAYDPIKQMFLPDRYIRGECPRCNAKDQYGDNCEVCGATYPPLELKNPLSVVSGATPIEKESEHYFFRLDKYTDRLKNWMNKGHLQEEVSNKLQEWFKTGLEPWDISRDTPYFGFLIPNTTDKYFYVWLDAPIGYMASLKNLADRNPQINFDDYWQDQQTTELYHFIGKDIIYFHALFWPAILQSAGFRTPTAIFAHGYLTINGQKMSKSRGTFIKARTYLNHLDPEYLRYYFAAKLTNRIDDIDLNFDDFMQRINSDLVGKIINIASRLSPFIHKKFGGRLADQLHQKELFAKLTEAETSIAEKYEEREYSKAIREIMELADITNQYIDEQKPWTLAKDENNLALVQMVCTQGLNMFRVLIIYLKPILPNLTEKVEQFLNCAPLTWSSVNEVLLDHTINPFVPLMQRIEKTSIDAIKAEAEAEHATA
jgi:methionyl-tRNA synthetase